MKLDRLMDALMYRPRQVVDGFRSNPRCFLLMVTRQNAAD
ncbi:hypothetical protein HMPREF0758_2529 [Serratia odorifera DSM 4582]|uniref:Uncharacterized protein n=1 Tax=Serratia odorifera DSM 4582 TaxID=667129 RepID=D4E2X9_SEROD|nr:hypothetical protein HMPREF0758_2529 [Serratia odorifera DSM 4582]